MLLERKRLILEEEMDRWIEKSREQLLLREATFSWAVACELRQTILGHKDPVDRLLVATAKTYDLTLITADERLMKPITGLKVLPNR